MKLINYKEEKLQIKKFQKIFFYAFNTIMQLFFTIVYIRIITLTWIFHDHPLVEYQQIKSGAKVERILLIFLNFKLLYVYVLIFCIKNVVSDKTVAMQMPLSIYLTFSRCTPILVKIICKSYYLSIHPYILQPIYHPKIYNNSYHFQIHFAVSCVCEYRCQLCSNNPDH